jgi:23S rRNA G2445 N2-methylase RlmL
VKLFATCARGLEDVSAAEVAELSGACADVGRDKVLFAATWAQVSDLQVRARTLHKLHLLLLRAEAKGLDDVGAAAKTVDWGAHIQPGQAIAVRPTRSGTHDFTSIDVGRVVGDAVVRGAARDGAKPRVDLEQPDVEVTALLRGSELLLGLNLTGESLHKRGYRVYQHAAPLRPSLAAALLRWAGYTPGAGLWDPMCGSGTIPIEAALVARAMPPNPSRPFLMERLADFPAERLAEARGRASAQATRASPPILGTERYEKHLLGAAQNARAAGVWDALHLRTLDATLARAEDLGFAPGLVALNPPYGLRIASKRVVLRLYRAFLDRMLALRPPRLALLVGNRLFEECAAERGLAPAEARDVLYGLLPARALRYDLTSS